jgi:hypothetical protein
MPPELLERLLTCLMNLETVIEELKRGNIDVSTRPAQLPDLKRTRCGAYYRRHRRTLVFTNSNRKVCRTCGLRGHVLTRCSGDRCFLCHKPGHSLGDCPELDTPAMLFEEEPVHYREACDEQRKSTTVVELHSVQDDLSLSALPASMVPAAQLDMNDLSSAIPARQPLLEPAPNVLSEAGSRFPSLAKIPLFPITFVEPCEDSISECGSPIISRGDMSNSALRTVSEKFGDSDIGRTSSSGEMRLWHWSSENDLHGTLSRIDGTDCTTQDSDTSDESESDYSSEAGRRASSSRRRRRRGRRRDSPAEFSDFLDTIKMRRHETLQEFATRLEDAYSHCYPGKNLETSRELLEKFIVSCRPKFYDDLCSVMEMKRMRKSSNWGTMRRCLPKLARCAI